MFEQNGYKQRKKYV